MLDELADDRRYRTFSVGEFYVDRDPEPVDDRVNVVVRIDVDSGFHLSIPLAEAMAERGLHASHYFLTHPDSYYNPWGSGVPRRVHELGQEVGLHTDHLYEEITTGVDGLARLKEDIQRLGDETGAPIRGMVYHGHPEIDAIGRTNWELTKDVDSLELSLEYHDGLRSCYIAPGAPKWEPRCDLRISDFFGFPNSFGWNYYPQHPLGILKNAQPGQVVHVAFHTKNAFNYWDGWTDEYGEFPQKKESTLSRLYKTFAIRWRYGLLRGKSLKRTVFAGLMEATAWFSANGVGLFWPRPKSPEPDISWEEGRRRIFEKGLDHWYGLLDQMGMTAPGETVLEVGSGNGQWLLAYAREAKRVVGVEPWRDIREFSVQKIAQYPDLCDKITVHNASAEALPVEDKSMDKVLCAGVFMFTKQDAALAEMARVLKPGGKLCLTVNGLGYFWMYVLNGFRYRSVEKMRYGLSGLAATILKWRKGKDLGRPTAVGVEEMKGRLAEHGLRLVDARLFLPHEEYPREHLGCATNYALIAVKEDDRATHEQRAAA